MSKTFEEMVEETMRDLYMRIDATDMKRHDVSVNINVNADYQGNITVGYNMKKGYSDATKGNTLDGTFAEFLRRQGWNERNRPMALIGSANVVEDANADES